ncbi:MAG TPA: DUF983 domain-containing protein [Gemmatimonadaceae bacterium]|nr:DUF983 domain-containing protein [Gemmatimonadaceae bacterium]
MTESHEAPRRRAHDATRVDDGALRVTLRMLRAAARRRCPRCEEGRIWDGWLKLRRTCDRCGFVAHRDEPDYFIGAYLVNLIVAELAVAITCAVVAIATWPDTPWDAVLWIGAAAAVIAPIVFYPLTVTLWLAVDVYFRPERD